jgi:glyoxylase-like metal-dependent hydrolase (beta-lactamase superfamily II)
MVAEDTHVIDVLENGQPHRTGAYVIAADGVTLVDPGSARGLGHLEDGLRDLGFSWSDVTRIVVTHVHLDHAGGVGHVAERAPRATIYCHPRAARHLADPSRLWAGATAVYGADRMERLWGSIIPVPAWRIRAQEDGSRVEAGSHVLRFFDSPGHARHHATILDERSGALFTGDAVGVRYDPRLTGWPGPYIIPTTSPSQFDPDVSLATLERLEALRPALVCHTHFAASPPADAFERTRIGLIGYREAALTYGPKLKDARDMRRVLWSWHEEDVARVFPGWQGDVGILADDLELNAAGLWEWWERRQAAETGKAPTGGPAGGAPPA